MEKCTTFYAQIEQLKQEGKAKVQHKPVSEEDLGKMYNGSFHIKSTQKIPDPHGFGRNLVLT